MADLNENRDFAMVHPNSDIHERPQIQAKIGISFLNEQFMEERLDL